MLFIDLLVPLFVFAPLMASLLFIVRVLHFTCVAFWCFAFWLLFAHCFNKLFV